MTVLMLSEEPGGAYSIVVLAASFFSQVFQYGVVWSVGIYYVIFIEAFDGGKSEVAIVVSLNTACFYCAGLFSSILTNSFGPRTVTIIGGLVGSLGVLLTAFATSISHLYLTFGFITGFGLGIAYIPGITIVTSYFKKRRSIALGIAVSGVSVGSMVFPPIIRLLVDHYGWRSALLVIASISFHICICGALMRPLQSRKLADDSIKTPTLQSSRRLDSCLQLFAILKNVSFLLVCLNNLLLCLGLSLVYVHLAAYATDACALSDIDGAVLLSSLGVANLIGRTLFGLLAYLLATRETLLYVCSFGLAGLATLALPLMTSFAGLIVYAVLFGLMTSSIGPLLPQVLIRVLKNVSLLSTGYGVILVFEAVGTMVGPPVAGVLYDRLQWYPSSFFFGGVSLVVGSLLLIPLLISKRVVIRSGNTQAMSEIVHTTAGDKSLNA